MPRFHVREEEDDLFMLKAMRENTKTILWITIVAFVGLIILVWGADLQLGKKGPTSGEIGSVNGERIPAQIYQDAYRQGLIDYRERSGAEPDDRTELLLREQVWTNLVDRILLQQEARKRGLGVTDEEIVQTLRTNPPDFLRQLPDLQTNGQFDPAKYGQLLQNPNVDWRPIEAQVRNSMPMMKLQALVMSSVKVTEQEVRDLYVFRNEKVKIAYAMVNPADFAVDGAQIEESELRRYYDEHKDDYKVPEQVKIEYVFIPRLPTPEDEQEIQQTLVSIEMQFKDGVPFEELVDTFSEASPAFRGGPTGMYLMTAQMPAALASRAATMPIGAVSDVFKDDQETYHLFRVEDRKTEDGTEKIKIQDIQLKIQPSESTVGELSQLAVTVTQEAREKGLAVAAGQHELKTTTTGWAAEGGMVRDLATLPGAIHWAHKSAVGDVSRPFESIQGWHILRVAEKRTAQNLSFEEIRERVRSECADAKSMEKARAHAERFYARIQAGVPFEQIAKEDALVEAGETAAFARSGGLGRLGRDPLLIGAAFRLPVGALSPLMESTGAVIAMRVLEKVAIDEQDFETNKGRLAEQIAREKQTLVYNQWVKSLRDGAEIEDFREIVSAG